MRCINCNNEVPDGSTVCPVCNSTIGGNEPISTIDTSVLPTVPVTPVMPADQNLDASNSTGTVSQENMNTNGGVNNLGENPMASGLAQTQEPITSSTSASLINPQNRETVEPTGVNIENPNMVQPELTPSVSQDGGVVENTPGISVTSEGVASNQTDGSLIQTPTEPSELIPANPTSMAASRAAAPTQAVTANQLMGSANQTTETTSAEGQVNTNTNPQPLNQTTSTQVVSQNSENPGNNGNIQVDNGINPEFITPNGTKVDNALPNKDVKKKNKTTIIIIAVVLVILLIAGIVFFLYYKSQYQSKDKRITAIVSSLTMGTKSLNNDKISKSSGTYAASLTINSTDATVQAKVNGTYATDLSAKAADYTLNLTSLNLGEELVDNPVNLELYLNDSRMYVLFQNYYENYIYDEVEGLNKFFDVNEQNNIDYISMINAFKNAFSSGLKGMRSTQTVGKAIIHGVSKKTNIIKIKFNESNRKIFFNRMLTSLANNQKFVSEAAKFSALNEEEFKNKLLETAKDESLASGTQDYDIEIYTAMFGEKLDGIKISSKPESELQVLEIYPITNGYGASYKEGSQNIFDIKFDETKKTTSTTREKNDKLNMVFYQEGKAFNIDFALNIVEDVNPKEARVNVKNSINKKYLTDEEKTRIITASASSGKIGLYLPELIRLYLYDGISYSTSSPDPSFDTGTDTSYCLENPELCN